MKSSIASGESRGSVPNILLKALQSGDKYGYEINKEIEIKSKGRYFLKEASLYSGLKRLEAAGFITSYWKDGELGMRRHYYSITEAGLEKLKNSNFTWDDSKTFMIEIFNDYKTKNNYNQNIASINNLENSEQVSNININQDNNIQKQQEIILNENINNNSENIIDEQKNNKPEVKKNPFQIEVSPNQQSIFDMNFSSFTVQDANTVNTLENNEKIEEIAEEKQSEQFEKIEETNNEIKIKEDFLTEKELSVENEKTVEDNKEENLFNKLLENVNETETEQEDKNNKITSKINYEQSILNYSPSSYSENIKNVNEKIDISKYLNQNKENDSNIILNKAEQNNIAKTAINEEKEEKLELQNFNYSNNDSLLKKNVNTETKFDEKEELNINVQENKKAEQNGVNLKNIFGNLLVEDNIEEKIDEIEVSIEKEETVEKIEKPALPRINVDNDINIMFNSNQIKPKTNIRTYNNDIEIKSGTNTVPNVKQYINNVHKKTLISRATKIEEEVNLEGINIREYKKINNKPIKNSNYVYTNKLNLFLAILFAGIIITECIISFVVLNSNKALGIFEIVLFSVLILLSLVATYLFALAYVKDKFKVELKNYNFKSSLFYLSLIFIVVSIILACINIFNGMNALNSSYFIVKLVLEILIAFNLVLLPIIKQLFYKLKMFSN